MKNENYNERFYLLDISRGFAAICVVLQHYVHFFYNSTEAYYYDQQPFYEYIAFGYRFGSVAVPFFFILSGFIFFTFYKKKISEKNITFKDFIILRISRLYPLHILTLFMMLILQKIYYMSISDYFVYKNISLENFILHIFLIQEWGTGSIFNFNDGWGFNGPSWSISVEFFAYISFFIVALFFVKNFFESIIFLIFLLIMYTIIQPSLGNMSLGVVLFYLGGATYYLTNIIKKYLLLSRLLLITVILALDILIFGRFLNSFFLEFQNSVAHLIGDRFMILLYLVKFPLLIINLNIIQFYFNKLGKPFGLVGDLSYTIYLIHFPLQVVIIIINNTFFKFQFYSELFFIMYFLFIFLTSFLLFKFFELPFKKLIRKKLITKKTIK